MMPHPDGPSGDGPSVTHDWSIFPLSTAAGSQNRERLVDPRNGPGANPTKSSSDGSYAATKLTAPRFETPATSMSTVISTPGLPMTDGGSKQIVGDVALAHAGAAGIVGVAVGHPPGHGVPVA